MGKPKSVGRLPLMMRQLSPPSSERQTFQWSWRKRVFGSDLCIAILWTQKPTVAFGSGMYFDVRPLFDGFHVLPPSSVRKHPAAEIAIHIRFASAGSNRIVCRHMPPALGHHIGLDG